MDLPPDVTCNQDTHQLTLNSKDDVIILTEAHFTPITVTGKPAISCCVCQLLLLTLNHQNDDTSASSLSVQHVALRCFQLLPATYRRRPWSRQTSAWALMTLKGHEWSSRWPTGDSVTTEVPALCVTSLYYCNVRQCLKP